MKHGLWFVLIGPLMFLSASGCMSVAQFAVCDNGDLEPTEECETYMNGNKEAGESCLKNGYQGGQATCRADACTWDFSTCTGNVNNLNNVNNINCDPLADQNPSCEVDQTCFYNPETSALSCEVPGNGGLGVGCFQSSECSPQMVCLHGTCTRMCDTSDITCYYGLACLKGYWIDDTWGSCPLVDNGCDPFEGTGCPGEGNACYMFYDSLWHTACLPAGPESVVCIGAEANECLPGYYCHDNSCLPLCDPMHLCSGTTCVPVAGGETGVCQ